ncbi:MAG: recombinase family protein [Candidatus Sericytochromatia bacterium]|nr:recombinase family protein [Candidatus Tanganyikabacteria bacterium]
MKAFGYVRVSTVEQAAEGVSLEAQAAKIAAYCAINELDLVGVVTDGGASGKPSVPT